LYSGNFKHFIPEDGLYVYFRKLDSSTLMVLVNNHPRLEKRFETERFQSETGNYTKAIELTTTQYYTDLTNIIIAPKSIMIFELK
jgi:neopullulanase